MSEVVEVTKVDEVHMRLDSDRGILREVQEHFSFEIEGARFNPKVKAKAWDGKIRLLNLQNQRMYIGLLDELRRFCEARDYELRYDYSEFADTEYSLAEGREFVESLAKRALIDLEVRDYQVESFVHCVRKGRALLLSPTSSGKSWMIYCLVRYYDLPTLIIVDSLGAVHQMAQDIAEYGFDPDQIHKVYGGQDKDLRRSITVSTWQSLQDQPSEWFDRFGLVIGDEAHHFAATSFTKLMEKIVHAPYRFGFTGTVKGSKCNVIQLEGLFGRIKSIVTTRELIDQGFVAEIDIKCIVLQYPDEVKRGLVKADYQDEIAFLVRNESRNRFITNLVGSLEGNTLLFFDRREHGEILLRSIRESFPDRTTVEVHGGVDGEVRNEVRQLFEREDDVIGVVSYGTFSTSLSIKNIQNLVFGAAFKAKIRNLQSIGRGLRMGGKNDKTEVTLYDVADNLIAKGPRGGELWKNHTIRHFAERIQIYSDEKFRPKIYNVSLRSTDG